MESKAVPKVIQVEGFVGHHGVMVLPLPKPEEKIKARILPANFDPVERVDTYFTSSGHLSNTDENYFVAMLIRMAQKERWWCGAEIYSFLKWANNIDTIKQVLRAIEEMKGDGRIYDEFVQHEGKTLHFIVPSIELFELAFNCLTKKEPKTFSLPAIQYGATNKDAIEAA